MSHDETAEAHHIQIIVFDPLMRRKVFMNQAGTNSNDFVGGNGRPDTTSANAYSSIHVSRGNGAGKRNNEIRIIVVFARLAITEIDHFITGLAQPSGQIFL